MTAQQRDYRLASEHPYPAALQDVTAASRTSSRHSPPSSTKATPPSTGPPDSSRTTPPRRLPPDERQHSHPGGVMTGHQPEGLPGRKPELVRRRGHLL